jgi:hypothetical protein
MPVHMQARDKGSDQVSEAIILLGSILYQVPHKVLGENRRVETVGVQGMHGSTLRGNRPANKKVRLMIDVGREIVGPRYSDGPVARIMSRERGRENYRTGQETKEARWAVQS